MKFLDLLWRLILVFWFEATIMSSMVMLLDLNYFWEWSGTRREFYLASLSLLKIVCTFREVCVSGTSTCSLIWNPSKILQSSIIQTKAAEHIITFGSRNPEIQSVVFDMVFKARAFGISICARWISRDIL